jgi:NADP-dependent 3-hydroxy acid dehydrogenase YdfG
VLRLLRLLRHNVQVDDSTNGVSGDLVFMSSRRAAAPTPAFADHGATKAAISHVAAIIRLEMAGTPVGITVASPPTP